MHVINRLHHRQPHELWLAILLRAFRLNGRPQRAFLRQGDFLCTFSLPPPSSLQITKHHLHPAPLSVTLRTFHSKLKFHLFKNLYPDSSDPLSPHPPPKLHPP